MIQSEEGASLGQPASLKRAGKGRDAASDAGRGPGASGSEGGAMVPGCCAPLTMRVQMPHHFPQKSPEGHSSTEDPQVRGSRGGAGEDRGRDQEEGNGPQA